MRATYWWLILHLAGAIIAVKGGSVQEERDLGRVDAEDMGLLVPELIVKYGYRVEEHMVVTEDGYVLSMFRMLPNHQSTIVKKKPVLLVHGVLASSAAFVIGGPNNSLAYLLSDNGYDVWLANMRGTRYSKRHVSLSVESKEYWDFSWHEMGCYDLTAMIDHVLRVSKSKKLFYIGHSQGTSVYFVMTSSRPQYNDKIALMIALSPAISWRHIRSPMLRTIQSLVRPGTEPIRKVLNALKIFEFLPYNENLTEGYYNRLRIIRPICQPEWRNNPCLQAAGFVNGPNPDGIDPRLFLNYLGHMPQGASVKQILHFTQGLTNGGKLRRFDYGPESNLAKYGSRQPPAYNLTASTAPVLIYYGLNDWLIHPLDAQALPGMLPRVIAAIPVADRQFNHMDFMLARNVRKVLYEKILVMLEKFNQ